MSNFARIVLLVLGVTIGLEAPSQSPAQNAAASQPSEATWNSIKDDIFKGRPVLDSAGLISLEAPRRAEDAAIVPITIRMNLPAGEGRSLRSLTLIVDENPAPVAGKFDIGANSGLTAISTRIRVNSYSYVRAIAELSDGQLYGVKAYVKASGGCSAPMARNEQDKSTLGQMKFRVFPTESGSAPEAQLMLRHPQNSGLQMDQMTRLYIPPFFIQTLKIWQGDDLVLALDGGISISQDPNLRFNYRPNGAEKFRAEGVDTSKNIFKGEWSVEKSIL